VYVWCRSVKDGGRVCVYFIFSFYVNCFLFQLAETGNSGSYEFFLFCFVFSQ